MKQNPPPYHQNHYYKPPDFPLSNVKRTNSTMSLSEIQNLLLQNLTLLQRIEEDYVENFLYDLLFEVAIDVLWSIKSGNTTIEEIYNVKPFRLYYSVPIKTEAPKKTYLTVARPLLPAIPTVQIQNYNGSTSYTAVNQNLSSSSSSGKNINCPICGELVAGSRFAYHLEKCMNGGKRGTRRHYDYLRDEVMERSRQKKEVIDPFPNSMIVRIKLKNGVPYGSCKRIGVSLEEFEACRDQRGKDADLPPNLDDTERTANRTENDGTETLSTNMNDDDADADLDTIDTDLF